MTALDDLLARARAPLGPSITLSLGADDGPLAELARLLSEVNGFTAFNAGIQVFHAGARGIGPELGQWNHRATWRYTYGELTDRLFFFAQDLFGVQFAIDNREHVVRFDPETAERDHIGPSLEDWAAWLLEEPDVRGAHRYATAWQDIHGALEHTTRLIPLRFFTLGGSYDHDNIVVRDAVTCMRIRGPLARQMHDLPDGARVNLMPEQAPVGSTAAYQQLAHAELEVFADYNSFNIHDAAVRFDPSDDFTDILIDDLIAQEHGGLGIGTARRMTVPVIFEARTAEPDHDPDAWDHITEASLHVDSGAIVVATFDVTETSPRITLPPGDYRVRVYYTGFDTISPDGIHGLDRYYVIAWPAPPAPPVVLKRYPHPLPGG